MLTHDEIHSVIEYQPLVQTSPRPDRVPRLFYHIAPFQFVVAIRGLPVKLTAVSSMTKLNSLPERIGAELLAELDDCAAQDCFAKGDIPSMTPPTASPCRNRRRELSGKQFICLRLSLIV